MENLPYRVGHYIHCTESSGLKSKSILCYLSPVSSTRTYANNNIQGETLLK